MILRSAYFPDFMTGPKVLFWGDAKAMFQLASLLRASSIGTGPLALGSFVEAADGRSIVIQTVPKAKGMRAAGAGFEWQLDPETMEEFAETIDVLAESAQPGHQYLECGSRGETTVMASCREYPADLNPRR